MKNQKGVTLMILVFTVAIMAIILATISYSSISTYKMNIYNSRRSDIELLDEKIALYYLENNTIPVVSGDTKDINDLIEGYNDQNINYNPNNNETLCKIDLSLLDNLTLKYQNYYIDEQSHTIYFETGVVIGDEIYHTLPANYQNVDLNLYK